MFHCLGICFLGHPTPPRLVAWSPAPALPERALGGFPRSVCPFFKQPLVADLRTVLYAVSHVSSGYHVPRYIVAEWGQVPFWACRLPVQALSRSAGSNSRRLRAFVEYPDHSHPFEASPLSASSLSLFTPCTPTFDNQSPAVG